MEALSNNPRVRPQLKTRSINARSPNVGLGTQLRNRQTNRSENAEVSRAAQFLPSKVTGVRGHHRLSYPMRSAGAFSSKQIRALALAMRCGWFITASRTRLGSFQDGDVVGAASFEHEDVW